MSVNGKTNDTFIADADLDAYQYTIMVNSTGPRVNRNFSGGGRSIGILQNKPKSGEHATVTVLGKTRVLAGGTITAGGGFTNTISGTAVAVTSGQLELGTAYTGVASGGIFEGYITHAGVTVVA